VTTTIPELYGVLLELREIYQRKLDQFESAEWLEASGTGYSNHQAEDATLVYDQTINVSSARGVKDRLRQVEDAIARHEANTYGTCAHCGREIDIARLEAIPYTAYCLHCAETREYHAGM